MKFAVSMVREFHAALGQAIDAPFGTDAELRLRLIREEVQELEEALAADDPVAAADALADIAYVVVGSAVTWGIPLAAVFDEVHRSNMTKRGAEKRADGKILKPAWYEPPDVAGVLARDGRPKPVCDRCDGTHRMTIGDRSVMCTRCPVPCQICRVGGNGAFCEQTPCPCRCHRKDPP